MLSWRKPGRGESNDYSRSYRRQVLLHRRKGNIVAVIHKAGVLPLENLRAAMLCPLCSGDFQVHRPSIIEMEGGTDTAVADGVKSDPHLNNTDMSRWDWASGFVCDGIMFFSSRNIMSCFRLSSIPLNSAWTASGVMLRQLQ